MLCQQDYVLRPRPQRRKRDDVEGKSIQQVRPKAPLGRPRGKVDVRCRNDPHISGDRVLAAQPLELSVLHHAQQFLLNLH